MKNNFEEENPNYEYQNQNSGEPDIQYPQQMLEDQNDINNQFVEKLPPIYEQKIASIKETTEHQVKYFEPIELAEGEDVNKFLSSGKLMKKLAPQIMQLKQQTQKEGMSNDPNVHTEIDFDIKQNNAIYEGNDEDDNEEDKEEENNNKNSQSNPGEIKYSSVLPPKFAKMKVVTIDQYGNRKFEGNEEEEEEDDIQEVPVKEENIDEQKLLSQSQMAIKQEELKAQEQEQLLLQKKLQEEQILLQQQIQQEQKKIQEEQIRQQQILQQQKLKEEQIRQQQLQQQKLKEEQIRKQQLMQQQRLLLQQQQQQNLINNKNPSVPIENNYPLTKSYSDNSGSLYSFNPNLTSKTPMNIKTVKINDQYNSNTIGMRQNKKDPIVQKVTKIYGTLRQRTQIPQESLTNTNMNYSSPQITPNPIISSNNTNFTYPQRTQEPRNTSNNINYSPPQRPQISIASSNNENFAAKLIQNKWRNHLIRKRFAQIKPKLNYEGREFLKRQYELCDRAGPIASDNDFNPEGWKRFYPITDPFFNFQKGFVIGTGVKVRHPNDPERISIYEGDVNIKNERHGFGRLTTVKCVYLGEWRNGQFTGWGRETRRSGKVYEGKYIDGLIQGKGILTNNKGTSYVGDFKNSKRHGKGILDTHKVHYEGEFKDDKLSGKGRITFKLEGHIYEGDFDNNEINGFGTFKWKNGDSYTGNMLNGKMHGNGKYTYNNGVVYEGRYNNGVKEGKGKYYGTNGMLNSEIARNINNQNNDSRKTNISGVSSMNKSYGNK